MNIELSISDRSVMNILHKRSFSPVAYIFLKQRVYEKGIVFNHIGG